MTQIIEVTNPFEPFKDTRAYSHPGGLTIRALLEEQYPGFKDFARPTICLVNGHPIGRKPLQDQPLCWDDYELKSSDTVNFIAIPGDPVTLLYVLYAVIVVALVVVVLTMPRPQLPGEIPEPDPVYDLKGQRNQNRLSHPIESAYGRCLRYPSYAARPWNSFEGNQQFQYTLYSLGQGEHDIESFQFEDTDISNFADVEYEVYGPGEPATMFPDNVVTSTEVAGVELLGPNEPSYAIIGPFSANEPGTQTGFLEVDIVFPAGLYHGLNNGSLGIATIEVLIEYREIDDDGDPVGSGDWLEFFDLIKNLATTNQQRYTLQLAVTPGRYEVRAHRVNAKQTSTSYGNIARWDALRAFLPSTKEYGQITNIAVKARATNNLNDQVAQRFNVWATRKLPIYDLDTETWSAPTATRNPIWAFCDVFRSEYGGQLEDTFLDLPALCALADDFDEEERYFDFVFDSGTTVWEAARTIGRVARCIPMLNGSQITLIRDTPKTVPTAVFTPDNIVQGSFEWEIKLANLGDFDGVEVEYIDPTTWKPETVLCLIGDDEGVNPEQIKLPGCTNRDFAYQEGMYIRSTRLLQRENLTFSTGLEGHIPTYGDLILVSHDLPRWGTSGIVRSIVGTTVTLSEPVSFGIGTFVIGFRKKDGTLSGPIECTVGSTAFEVILDEAPADSFFFDDIHERPMFLFGPTAEFSKQCLVVGLSPAEDHTVQVNAVVYNEDVFLHDSDTAPAVGSSRVPSSPNVPVLNCSLLVARWEPTLDGKVRVSWGPAVGARAYRVDVSTDGTNFDTVGETPLTFLVVDHIAGTDFQFRVIPLGIGSIAGALCLSAGVDNFRPDFPPPPPPDPPEYPDYFEPSILYPSGASFEVFCRTRGGTASKIGYAEYTGASTPPKKYRKKTNTGSASSNAYNDNLCTDFYDDVNCDYDGVNEYGRLTGSLSQTGGSVCDSVLISSGAFDPVAGCDCTVSLTQTTSSRIMISGVCCYNGSKYLKPLSDSLVATLSVEDTEADALERLILTLDDWDDISFGDPGSGCSAVWGVCTSGFTFPYTEGQMRVTGSAYYGSWDYTLRFDIMRRAAGSSDPFTKVGEIDVTLPSDGSGDIDETFDVPNERGYETYLSGGTLV